MTTKIGDVISVRGPEIPDDVTAVNDRDGTRWVRTPVGHWHLASRKILCSASRPCDVDGVTAMAHYLPLTVVKVRPATPATPATPPVLLDIPARMPNARRVRVHYRPPVPGTIDYVSPDGIRWHRAGASPAEAGSLTWRGLFALGAVEVIEREPRTFPQVDDAPCDLQMVGLINSNGIRRAYRRSPLVRSEWRQTNRDGRWMRGMTPQSWPHLRTQGDLVEIFDPATFLTTNPDTDD